MKMKKFKKISLILYLIAVLVVPIPILAGPSGGITPSSPFYFFDTTFEKVSLFFTFNPLKKAEKALKYAGERLSEAEESSDNSEAVEKAINGYEEQISLATEESKIVEDSAKAG